MRTTATNRKLRLLLTGIRNGTLVPNPAFQRRLVWTNKDKRNFLDTVLKGYPFPEIYIAAGSVNAQTGEGTEMLVDGQQRITTLYQYFSGARELRLGTGIPAYKRLTEPEKIAFLEYEVVVRDLGSMSNDDIRDIFRRINATGYSLNAMEIQNARFDGEFKRFAEKVAQFKFFDEHHVFSANEIRRMRDVSFTLIFIISIMSNYFNRDDELETYLENYNDEFAEADEIEVQIKEVLDFIDACQFLPTSRVWKLSDLLSLLVELHRVLIRDEISITPQVMSNNLVRFYNDIDHYVKNPPDPSADYAANVPEYARLASQATNDRGTRIRRGEIIREILLGEATQPTPLPNQP